MSVEHRSLNLVILELSISKPTKVVHKFNNRGLSKGSKSRINLYQSRWLEISRKQAALETIQRLLGCNNQSSNLYNNA